MSGFCHYCGHWTPDPKPSHIDGQVELVCPTCYSLERHLGRHDRDQEVSVKYV